MVKRQALPLKFRYLGLLMTDASTVAEFSKNAAQSFIETVVFVDDKIYAQTSSAKVTISPKIVTPPKIRKPARKGATKQSPSDETPVTPESLETSYSPHDIQASFAKQQIVCSLHQPSKSKSVGLASDTFKLCACADIVILDWDMYGDAGVNTTELTKNLIEESLKENPYQLRLVLIYTDSPNLHDVSNSIFQGLGKESDKIEYKKEDSGLAFHTTNTRVVVLGKPATRLEEYKLFEVKEQELADRSISEFCKLADGLLQASILTGLAAIRKQSKRVLTKFHSGLDPALLTHRALGLPHEEAFQHMTPLLVAEIEAILEDSLPDPLIGDSVITDWCKNQWQPAEHASSFIPDDINVTDFAEMFCTKGMKIGEEDAFSPSGNSDLAKTIKNLRNSKKWPSSSSPAFKKITTFLSETCDGIDHQKLSEIMSLRSYYVETRGLTLGTIISREVDAETEEYLLCLQPVCDSLRLKEQTSFMFCKLPVTDGQRFTHTIDGEKLIFRPKSSNCVTVDFQPNNSGTIQAKSAVFTSSSGASYTWRAQLNAKHAQRAAEQFASQLSRVGLTESEWTRLQST